jgi:hypothetical protein
MQPTYSDYVGIRNILQSFGILFGFGFLPDLIHPDDFADEAIKDKMNLYCIASPKANRWTGKLLENLNQKWGFGLSFKADKDSWDLKNVLVSIFLNNRELCPDEWEIENDDRRMRDFGMIVRAPNPFDEKYMVVILAGRSSLGTEAACMAFTKPEIIRQIWERKLDLNNHMHSFCALVSLERQEETKNGDKIYVTDPTTLEVERVIDLTKRSKSRKKNLP